MKPPIPLCCAAFGLLMGLLAAGCASAPRVAAPAVETGMLAVAGGQIYFEAAGQGAPVVFIHGGFGDRRMWDGPFRAFAGDYRVVRYDHRGFGRSPAPDSAYSPADDLRRLLDRLGIAQAHVVGNSMGGTLALDFALLNPSRVRSLVVVAAGPGGLPVPEADVARVIAVFEAAQSEGLDAAAARWEASPMVQVTSRDAAAAPALRVMIRDNARAFRMPFRFWPGETLTPPASARLGEIAAPTLVVVGAEDTPYVRGAAEAAAQGIAGATRQVIDGADHLPQMAQPEAFARALRAFLRLH